MFLLLFYFAFFELERVPCEWKDKRLNFLDRSVFACNLYIFLGGGRRKPNVMLWGDSHAFHYVGMLEEFAISRQSSFVHSCMAACPPMVNVREGQENNNFVS